jgi:hypothetical protein
VAVTEQARARVVYRPPDQRSARPAGRPGRLGVLGLVAVVFAGGMLFGRTIGRQAASQDPAAVPAASAPQATSAPAGSQEEAPTVTAGTPEANPAASRTAGPRKVVDGVGVGWARTRKGALGAATSYAMVLSGDLLFDNVRRDKALAVLAAPEARAGLQRAWAETVPVLRRQLRLPATGPVADKVVLWTSPLGYSIKRSDDAAARIAIWTTSFAGSTTGIPVVVGYGVTTIDLKWVGGDWKQVRATTRPAPIPLPPDNEVPSAASAFVQQTRTFKGYSYAPGS